MSFESCTRELAAARGKDIPKFVLEQIEAVYQEAGERHFSRIVNDLIRCDHMPSNLYGAIKSRWEEARRYSDKSALDKSTWTAKEDCVSGEEAEAFTDIINEILLWHSLKLVESNYDGCRVPMNVEEYIKAGCPKSWSPMVDHFLGGYIQAYKTDLEMRGYLLDYLQKYAKQLKNSRAERTQKKFD